MYIISLILSIILSRLFRNQHSVLQLTNLHLRELSVTQDSLLVGIAWEHRQSSSDFLVHCDFKDVVFQAVFLLIIKVTFFFFCRK